MSARLWLLTGLALIISSLAASQGLAGSGSEFPLLPPEPAWEGRSVSLTVGPDHPWATEAERTAFETTADYEQTAAWLQRLDAASDRLNLVSLGHSHEGREVWMAIASNSGAGTAAEIRASRLPTVLVQGGIHSGEIDGKEAGMMLLRDLLVTGRLAGLLERVNVLFVPILNVDGHERAGGYSRINQRGPRNAGWRTNARNQNLNRDYAKLDAPETRAVVGALESFDPDLYFDIHVTDGIDYQYDITYGWNGPHAWSPAIAAWLDEHLRPAIDASLVEWGHVPGPLIFAVDSRNPAAGIWDWTAGPRFSNGYGSARQAPTVLVENHSLKSFRRRVLGTRVMLEASVRLLAAEGRGLRQAIERDRASRLDPVPLSFRAGEGDVPTMTFLGIAHERFLSPVSGDVAVRWTAEPVTLEVPVRGATEVDAAVNRPAAYWIPPGWPEVVERLEAHGIAVERVESERTLDVEVYRLEDADLADRPYEGRVTVKARAVPELREQTFPAGSVRVSTDQPLGTLAVLLLEPASADSFFGWGFFLECLQRTEYAERYVLEPLARRMLAESPELAEEFEQALMRDESLRNDTGARLAWFYERSPWYDQKARIYPVAREPRAAR